MIIGHHKQWNLLKRSVENDRVAHAYLFYGPAKIGKRTIALEFAKLLTSPIGKNTIVPDLILIEPEYPTDEEGELKEASRAVIHILQIQDMKSRLFLSAINAGSKVAIIDEAPAMTADAQGALLKLLEEPKGKTVIILLAQHLNQLLPTIVSRCQPIRFNLLAGRDIEKYLIQQKVSVKRAQELSWLSFGRPGLAIDCFNDSDKEKFQRTKIQQISQLVKAPLKLRFQYAEKLSQKRGELNRVLEIWLNYFRELLLDKLGKRRFPESFERQSYSVRDLKKIINLIEKIKFVLSHTNANSRLALEILLLKM
jgi:DNA polymerase-3 subunit delta'